ncbi:MAG: hypothetical protein PUI30_10485 [Bacteroidales bacterium]|nr:hypothetical protein [Bacteroidales bacterium]
MEWKINVVTLHQKIRDVHRSSSDSDYFLSARKHQKIRDVHRSSSDSDYFLSVRNSLIKRIEQY